MVKKESKTKSLTLRLPEETWVDLAHKAIALRTSKIDLIRKAIDEFLNKNKE